MKTELDYRTGESGPVPDPSPGLSVVVPVFNEEAGIAAALRGILSALERLEAPYEVVVVDDGSTDGTHTVLSGLDGITILRHDVNAGYGAALKTGIRAARFEWVCIIDGDGTYPSEQIPDLFARTDHADMVVGARTQKGARAPWVRRPAKWLITKLACHLAGARIPDLNSGLRIMKKPVVERFLRLLPDGFSFTSTITLAMATNAYRIAYVPIPYATRVGRSKIRPIYDTLNFIQLIVRMVMYFNPLRVFLPMSMGLFLTAAGMLAYRAIYGAALGVTTVVVFLSAFHLLAIGLLADLIDKRVR